MTTMGVLGWFVLAMVLYPEVQHRAQVELDRVVGRERLPSFEDYKNMPYMQAMVSLPLVYLGETSTMPKLTLRL